ncbi:major facilitator superfamily domain-containing protein 6 isoform X1 [Anopheles darlingi]|uniref:major facilitator superfamily domain-containing protein 6 isoform X1 n=1 Tax=Anopheles darlingi TaxID=43151 RepID=UPI0020FFF62E|nr:major facilitator superfamily domain-containing protein 6 isoform X1 [Anopheles darlingi]XP_049545376.1 major facilitator superfamily domain-containing protein 6 isoform X1 [Anopheles darlingi]XP_049545377.1 major facilitator superfamily domain-containing protein 6 isoform X1 [Anopheles darlingi]XP_049545378.1 major facilitator superfamily domain-containing protein 6 isoform X1 [Anopheles darlingi]
MVNFQVNKKLLPMKAHYFLFNAGTAPVVPFMPTLVKQLGFSSVIVGTIYTVLPIVGMLVKPLFGIIADRFQRQKLLFLIFQILTAIPFFLIMFIPAIPQETTVSFHCHEGVSDFRYCPDNGTTIDKCLVEEITQNEANNTMNCYLECDTEPWMWDTICKHWNVTKYCDKSNIPSDQLLHLTAVVPYNQVEEVKECLFFMVREGQIGGQTVPLYCPANTSDFRPTCRVHCDNERVMEAISNSHIPDSKVTGLYQFWLLFLFLIASWAGMAVVVSVGDAICFEMLGDKPHLYGNQRLWGSIGWGTVSLFAGFLVDTFSEGKLTKDYTVVFYMTVVLIGFDILCSSKLQHTQTRMSTNILKDVGQIFASFRVVVFFCWCVMIGLGTALIWNFLFWHLEDLAKAMEGCGHSTWIKTLQGIIMSIQTFGGELPFFFLSGWILKKIGHIHAMSLVLLGFGVRFLLYSYLVDPWWVIPIEFMNGITFGLFYATMASYASIVAPPGTEATMQGLVGAVFEGVGVSLGSLLAGHLFEHIGGSATFRSFGWAALALFVVHVVVQALTDRFGAKGKLARKENDFRLATNEGPDGAMGDGHANGFAKTNSILSDSTVQEDLVVDDHSQKQDLANAKTKAVSNGTADANHSQKGSSPTANGSPAAVSAGESGGQLYEVPLNA